MSGVDRLKEELSWLRLTFGIVLVIDASMIAWLFQHYEGSTVVVRVAVGSAIAFVTGVGAWLNLVAMKRFKKLGVER